MEQKKNAPAIRFNGFYEQWNKNVLGDIGKTFTGLSGKTKEDFGFGAGRFVTYMNVFSNIISDLKKIDKVQIDKTQNSVQFGDVFFTTSSETPEEVGMSSVWLFDENNVYLNSFCFGYRPTVVLNHYYLAYYLRSSSFRKKMIPLAQGISRYNISKGKVMNLDISLPCENEQTQIGNFFRTLDGQINAQEQKHQKLVNLKKAMLEKMFPKEGADVPEIRFNGFTDKWEEKKLGDVVNMVGGGTPSTNKHEFWEGNIPWISSSDLLENDILNISIQKFINIDAINKSATKIIPKGSILVVSRVGVGKFAIAPENICTSQDFTNLIITKSNIYNKFLAYYLYSNKSIFYNISQGTSIKGFTSNDLSLVGIKFPSLAEQQKIGEYFEQLDTLIQQSQVQIKKYKNIKQSLLQKMFV